MSKEDLINQLGTPRAAPPEPQRLRAARRPPERCAHPLRRAGTARSTWSFIEAFYEGADGNLIGQFGRGGEGARGDGVRRRSPLRAQVSQEGRESDAVCGCVGGLV